MQFLHKSEFFSIQPKMVHIIWASFARNFVAKDIQKLPILVTLSQTQATLNCPLASFFLLFPLCVPYYVYLLMLLFIIVTSVHLPTQVFLLLKSFYLHCFLYTARCALPTCSFFTIATFVHAPRLLFIFDNAFVHQCLSIFLHLLVHYLLDLLYHCNLSTLPSLRILFANAFVHYISYFYLPLLVHYLLTIVKQVVYSCTQTGAYYLL